MKAKVTEDYQLGAFGGAAGRSELGLDESDAWLPPVVVVKYLLGAASRAADGY